MASSDHMASVDPTWIFSRPSFIDPWFTEAYSRDTETLTKALQKSISSSAATATATTSNNSNNSSDTLTPDVVSPFLKHLPEPAPSTPAAAAAAPSWGSSDQEAAASKQRQRASVPGASGKVSKRKSRASKRSQTTYINADPANFRQMVQQVTGARFVGAGLQVSAPILKPEPQRLGGARLVAAAAASGCLPTLDTSAFLLDHHAAGHHNQQQQQQQEMSAARGEAPGPLSFLEAADVACGGGGGSVSGGYDFGSFAGFPTLESWSASAM
ncbi:calmodulin-binding protein 25-like [Syzygium oleosum]|uniref:calmodulin-binding protein 25-like n=1 Tax=Syzygium oleosum TaxID=219896 RepID=UPI0024BB3AFD|nr:calmodulin-binding protein 25-like [Syzygium oleosum]